MKKIKITIENTKDKVDKAVEVIKEYCLKHPSCSHCRFYDIDNGECMFEKIEFPYNWKEGAEE